MSISVVMPCYNEGEVIEKTIRDYYNEVIRKIDDSEFIVVDDCSKDNTHDILEGLRGELPKLKILKTPVNSGHGKTVRMGYETAKKDYVFQVDSDRQFEPKDFWKLYTLKDSYDFILGFRKRRHDPLSRLILTRIVRLLNLCLFGVWIKDCNCPFRIVKKEILDKFLNLIAKEAIAPNIMISILAKKKGIKMVEVPVAHYRRRANSVSLAHWKLIKYGLEGLVELAAFKKSKLGEIYIGR